MDRSQQKLLVRYPNALEEFPVSEPKNLPVPNGNKAFNYLLDNFIKAETNLERLPFFAPWTKSRSKRLKHTLNRKVNRDGVEIEISWTVSANPEYGYPNAFDMDVYRAIQQIIHDYYPKGVPEDGRIAFSFRQVLQRMHQKSSGRLTKDIRQSLERMVATTVKSKGAFYYKETKRFVDDIFHIFDRVTFIGETMSSGEIADTNYLVLSGWYRDSIRTWYVMPLDTDFHFKLSTSNAKTLYGLLSFYFYCRPQGQEWIRRRYSDLCQETIITQKPYFSTGFSNMRRAFEELIENRFLAKVETEPLEGRKDDGWIYFWPGERVLYPERFRFIEPQPLLWDEEQPPLKTSKRKVIGPVVDFDEAASLITRFYAELSDQKKSSRAISKKERDLVTLWLKEHGSDYFSSFIDYAIQQKKTRWPEMASLTGALNAYGDEFIKIHQEQLERQSQQQEAENEWALIEALRPHYRDYFNERLKTIQIEFPEKYEAYLTALKSNSQYSQMRQAIANGSGRWEGAIDTIEENIAKRFFSAYANAEPAWQILDFVEWRERHENEFIPQQPL